MTSLPLAAFLLLGSGLIFSAGVRIAIYRRARADYRDAQRKVPGARSAFWAAWRKALFASFWIAVGALVLAVWVAHDVREQVGYPTPSVEAT